MVPARISKMLSENQTCFSMGEDEARPATRTVSLSSLFTNHIFTSAIFVSLTVNPGGSLCTGSTLEKRRPRHKAMTRFIQPHCQGKLSWLADRQKSLPTCCQLPLLHLVWGEKMHTADSSPHGTYVSWGDSDEVTTQWSMISDPK